MMALALGSVGFGAFKMNSAEMMPVSDGHVMPCACSVSVISMECHEDLQSLYLDDPEEGMCKAFRIGERWHFGKGEQCPHGFCHKAWKVLVIAVSELLSSPDTGLCCKPPFKGVYDCVLPGRFAPGYIQDRYQRINGYFASGSGTNDS